MMKNTKYLFFTMAITVGLTINAAYAEEVYQLPEPEMITIDKSLIKEQGEPMILAAKIMQLSGIREKKPTQEKH